MGQGGFDEVARADFAPASVRTALLRNPTGAGLELTAHKESAAAPPAAFTIAYQSSDQTV